MRSVIQWRKHRWPTGVEVLEDRQLLASDLILQYQTVNDWGAGFQGALDISNHGQTNVQDWQVTFEFDGTIADIWNARIVSHKDSQYVIENLIYNGDIQPDGVVHVGFLGITDATMPMNFGLAESDSSGGGSQGDATPSVSIADASISEGDSSTTPMQFSVSLSAASEQVVTVDFATQANSASSSRDFVQSAGRIEFLPGKTQRWLSIEVVGDDIFEIDELFTVTLFNATRATVADGEAVGRIANDDVLSLPTISATGVNVVEGNPETLDSDLSVAGYFHTQGNQIVDSNNQPVRIAGINWFGFETAARAPHGLSHRGYRGLLDQIQELGFNTIRLPFSNAIFDSSSVHGIDSQLNPDLQGLTSLEILDRIVDYSGQIGLRIILDRHTNKPDSYLHEDLWYIPGDADHSEQVWVSNWVSLANRYAGDPTVIGADLNNEPHGQATWGSGDLATDWRLAAQRAGNAIHEANPDWLIFVEGIQTYGSESTWWGGNLMGVREFPVELNVANRVVYAPHDYATSVWEQSWFNDPNYPNNLPALWDQWWGYIYRENIAPVWLGEFGTTLANAQDRVWLDRLTDYLDGDFDIDGNGELADGQVGLSWSYWALNPNSGDTGGILNDDWQSVNEEKLSYLLDSQFPLAAGRGGATFAEFEIALSQPSIESVTVDFYTEDGTASQVDDYSLARGTLNFEPGVTTQTVSVPITQDLVSEEAESFNLVLSNPSGGVLSDQSVVTAKILDDDDLQVISVHVATSNETDDQAVFHVSLSGTSDVPISVDYRTTDGTATAGADYVPLSGSLTFLPGETTKPISIEILNDLLSEPAEDFYLELSGVTNALISDTSIRATVFDDDTSVAGLLSVQFSTVDDWGAGFTADLTIVNDTDDDLNDWVVEFEMAAEITNMWNAEIVSHVGSRYVVRAFAWNALIAKGTKRTFGFQATAAPAGNEPSEILLNDQLV